MRVLVTGGRDFDNPYTLYDTLESLGKISVVIQGEAQGADKMSKAWAQYNKIPTEDYPADWSKEGKSAGPKRNSAMLEKGKPDLVVAFPGGAGTADMVRKAKAAGVPVKEIKCEKDWRDEPDAAVLNRTTSSTRVVDNPGTDSRDVRRVSHVSSGDQLHVERAEGTG